MSSDRRTILSAIDSASPLRH